MQLLIDIGSSAIKWAICEGESLSEVESVLYADVDIVACLQQAWSKLVSPERILISNVGGDDIQRLIADYLEKRWPAKAEWITVDTNAFGVTNGYRQPQQLGVDRWLNLIAVHTHFPGHSCIIDCGTAVTIDVLDPGGNHLGGMIIPGRHMMQQSLLEASQGIQRAFEYDLEPVEHDLLAIDTRSAMAVGSLYTIVALVDRICTDIAAETATPLQCILTGGDAKELLELLDCEAVYVEGLVLTGLAVIGRHNRGGVPE